MFLTVVEEIFDVEVIDVESPAPLAKAIDDDEILETFKLDVEDRYV